MWLKFASYDAIAAGHLSDRQVALGAPRMLPNRHSHLCALEDLAVDLPSHVVDKAHARCLNR